MQDRDEPLKYLIVKNDATSQSCLRLIGFKSIISKALPNMDKPHIIRLLFDHRHQSLLAYHEGELIGGACIAIFSNENFAELAFLAVKADKRIQGFGKKIMNKLKSVLQQRQIAYMITYGDNMALGFFRKQGFSERITMSREKYEGFIKEYDGGKLMEFKLHPSVDYINIGQIIAKQKQFVIETIKSRALNEAKFSTKAIDQGEQISLTRKVSPSCVEYFRRNPIKIPGVVESGWTWQEYDLIKKCDIEPFSIRCNKLLLSIKRNPQARYFLAPVSPVEVPSYYSLIKKPMDISTIEERLSRHEYKNEEHFCSDIEQIFENCKTFNHPDSVYYKNCLKLQQAIAPELEAFRHVVISTQRSQ